MPILPVRNLAERGIVLDVHPYDLPTNAFSGGSNVRFAAGKASRAPIFRTVSEVPDPQTVVGYRPSSGFDLLYTGGVDGALSQVSGSTVTDVTPTGRTLGTSPLSWTHAFLGDVLYMNRPDFVPAALLPAATDFVNLAEWDSTWRCRSLRAFKDFLFAFNVTKGAASFPSTIKWSDATLAGQMPGSWDPTDLSTLANEVVLAQLDTPLVDALPLRGALIVYSETQVWATEYTGDTSDAGQNLFVHRPIFNDRGMISPNCAVEVGGKHYVFGLNDLWVHDGTQHQSIADGRVRDWVFKNLNQSLAERCFVAHLAKHNEILFGFVSGDADAAFVNPTGCNRAVVFNYATGVWSPIDLPNVSAMGIANVDSSTTWADAGDLTWASTGGSWYDLGDGRDAHLVFCASPLVGGVPTPRLLAYDFMDNGSLSFPYDPFANAPAYLERTFIDLDAEGSDLATYKVCKRIFPQVSLARDVPILVHVGSSNTPSGPVEWSPPVSFRPATGYKVDVRRGGRYLAVRFTTPDAVDFSISGFDADVVPGGRR